MLPRRLTGRDDMRGIKRFQGLYTYWGLNLKTYSGFLLPIANVCDIGNITRCNQATTILFPNKVRSDSPLMPG